MDVQLRGPLFDRSPHRMVRGVLDDALEQTGVAGVKAVQDELVPGRGVDTGDFEQSLRRKHTGLSETVYSTQPAKAAWLEGVSRRNRTTSFKGYHIFMKGARTTQQRADQIVRKAGALLTRELGG